MKTTDDLSIVTKTVIVYKRQGITLHLHAGDERLGPIEGSDGEPLRWSYIDQPVDLAEELGLPDPMPWYSEEALERLRARCEKSRKRDRHEDLPLFERAAE